MLYGRGGIIVIAPVLSHPKGIHADCPQCHWTQAVVVFQALRKQCLLCPHCQYVWDLRTTTVKPRQP
jgi:hypothetical protein